jgi:chromosome segregation ATPase
MIDRNLIQKRNLAAQINVIEEDLVQELSNSIKDEQKICELRAHSKDLQDSIKSISREYLELESRKDALFKNLKSTRDQRYKQAEESKSNFWVKLAELAEMKNREKDGRWMEIMAKAGEKAHSDLEQEIQYEDGTFDRPILTPESVEKDSE